jgi:hypothetical protein
MARVRERVGDRETAAPGPDHWSRARPAWMTKCGTAHLCPPASMAVMLAAADCTVQVPVGCSSLWPAHPGSRRGAALSAH